MSSVANSRMSTEFKATLNQAIALINKDQLEAAAGILEQLRGGHPDSASVHALLADIRWHQANLTEAIALFQTAVALSPTSEMASLGLFHTLYEAGDKPLAIAEMNRFRALAPSNEYDLLADSLTAT